MNEQNRRRYPRITFDWPGCLYRRRGGFIMHIPYICDIIDVSAGGVRLQTDMKLEVGEEFLLLCSVKTATKRLHIYGTVNWKDKFCENIWIYGASIHTEGSNIVEELDTYVKQVMREEYS